jgi:hypothetical protein
MASGPCAVTPKEQRVKYTIAVLQDDIDKGTPGSSHRCALALAAGRELFRDDITVCGQYLNASQEFHAKLPETARTFIPRFDSGAGVEPFKFEIETVDGPRPFAGVTVISIWAHEMTYGFSQVLKGGPADLALGYAYQYQQFAGYQALAFKDSSAKSPDTTWTPEFGSVPMTYEPSAWTPAALDVTATS